MQRQPFVPPTRVGRELRAGDRPRGFTIAESAIALAILGVIMAVVAQVGLWAIHERMRVGERQTAQELAANVLERARACPWDELTSEWGAAQTLPEAYAGRGWKLEVRVESQESRPLTRQVSVTLRWKPTSGPSYPPIELVGLFAARSAEVLGGKP
jgi:prepilin-type N-terminal cleavage/methylation domain-containing protein